jgi:hypothetical protein
MQIRNLFDPGSGSRDKHPGSATLESTIKTSVQKFINEDSANEWPHWPALPLLPCNII